MKEIMSSLLFICCLLFSDVTSSSTARPPETSPNSTSLMSSSTSIPSFSSNSVSSSTVPLNSLSSTTSVASDLSESSVSSSSITTTSSPLGSDIGVNSTEVSNTNSSTQSSPNTATTSNSSFGSDTVTPSTTPSNISTGSSVRRETTSTIFITNSAVTSSTQSSASSSSTTTIAITTTTVKTTPNSTVTSTSASPNATTTNASATTGSMSSTGTVPSTASTLSPNISSSTAVYNVTTAGTAVPVQSTSTLSSTSIATTSTSVVSSTVAESSMAWIAAPIVVGSVVLAVVLGVVIFLCMKRRRNRNLNKRAKNTTTDKLSKPFGGVHNPSFRMEDDFERPPRIRVEDFVNRVAELHRDSDYGFASEFAALGKQTPQHPKTSAELPENRTKNRFTNVLPFDHSRVRLIPIDDDDSSGSDYINASFLPGFSSIREFIAAQGPMKSTIDDFWRMIWEYNITTIVMVTNLIERGREKCAQYWPEQNEPIYYGDIQIELKSESSLSYYIVRIFSVTQAGQSRRVTQYQFLTWPDFGVPSEHDHLLSFLTQIRSSLPRNSNHPVLIHCSAGVGRTGTFIVIDHVLQLIRTKTDVDVFGMVLDLRNYRANMIQTEAQYIFAHECIKYAIEHGYHQAKDVLFLQNPEDANEVGIADESSHMNPIQRKD